MCFGIALFELPCLPKLPCFINCLVPLFAELLFQCADGLLELRCLPELPCLPELMQMARFAQMAFYAKKELVHALKWFNEAPDRTNPAVFTAINIRVS